jgi:hypothetical protein
MKVILTNKLLRKLYQKNNKSVSEIAGIFKCSENKVNYWLKKNNIAKRSISEAVYLKKNPFGDPFKFIKPKNIGEAILFGIGIGLYWGEGTKANKNTVRLGNSDPAIIRSFIKFLEKFFGVKVKDLKFHLHLFSDINPSTAFNFWIKELKISKKQFYKPTTTITGKLGTYRKKSKFGVVTIYFGNTKLRNKLIELLPL